MYSYAIRMSVVCIRMSSVCHSYVLVCHPYVTRMSSVCHSYVLVCHPYVTRMYSYVIHMSLVCTRMSSVCHSYILACHPYVTRMWFYHEPFKEAFIEQIKPNLKEIFIDEIREIIKEELSDLEKVSSTVNLAQKQVSSLKESNIALQKKCSDLELSIDNNEQYTGRTCLRIINISFEEKETSEEVLKKVKKVIKEEAEVNIPEETIDKVNRVRPKKNKNQTIIVKFSTFRHRTLFYRAKKKLKNGVKLHIDLTKSRFNLMLSRLFKVKKMLMSMSISVAICDNGDKNLFFNRRAGKFVSRVIITIF